MFFQNILAVSILPPLLRDWRLGEVIKDKFKWLPLALIWSSRMLLPPAVAWLLVLAVIPPSLVFHWGFCRPGGNQVGGLRAPPDGGFAGSPPGWRQGSTVGYGWMLGYLQYRCPPWGAAAFVAEGLTCRHRPEWRQAIPSC